MNVYLKISIRFLMLVLLQVLVLNRVTLLWWTEPTGFPPFSPHIYQLFILLLPFETPVWVLLILGFITGISIDTFMNTAGIHTFATVLLAYLRTNVLTALLPRNLSEYSSLEPTIKTMGGMPFLVYSLFLILVHHFVYYLILVWSFTNFGRLMLQVGAATLTSMLFVVVYVLLFTKQAMTRL